MATINLLPWRQWERERKQTQFLASLAGVFAVGAFLVMTAGFFLNNEFDEQKRLNERLESDIAVLDSKITEIAALETQREELLSRMRIIQELQGNRPIIVRVFDELVRKLSKGVHFSSLQLQGNVLSASGVAESNNRISTLMRNINSSNWFTKPNLKSIQEDTDNPDYGSQASAFELTFLQSSGKKDGEKDEEKDG